MEFHELASIFPMMGEEEYRALVQDIAKQGLLEPIWLYEGKIIDGRNRYQACQELGIAPRFRTWRGRGSPLAFVISLNLSRRHLTSSQKAVVALEVEKRLAKEAKQQQGKRTDLLQKLAKRFGSTGSQGVDRKNRRRPCKSSQIRRKRVETFWIP